MNAQPSPSSCRPTLPIPQISDDGSSKNPSGGNRGSADALIDHLTGGVDDRDNQWHLPQSMCGTTQARVIGADAHFDGVHHAFGDLGLATQVVVCDAAYRSVEHLVVLSGGHDEIRKRDASFAIGTVMMQQGATRRFHHPDSLTGPPVGGRC